MNEVPRYYLVPRYYVVKSGPLYELRQTRFLGKPGHPHAVLAVARSVEEMRDMAIHFTGGIDWSRVTP